MAENSLLGRGLHGLAKAVVSSAVSKKTQTTPTKLAKPGPLSPSTSKTSSYYSDNFVTGSSDYENSVNKIVARIAFNQDLMNLGRDTSQELNENGKNVQDISDQSIEIQNNFDVVAEQIGILSNFVFKIDTKVDSLKNVVKDSITGIAAETAKSQVVLVESVNKKLDVFTASYEQVKSKVETHDRQIDELYADLKAREKRESASRYLNQKKSLTSNDNSKFVSGAENNHGFLGNIIKDLLDIDLEEALGIGAGIYAGKKIIGAGARALGAGARAVGKGAIFAGKELGKGAAFAGRELGKGAMIAGEGISKGAGLLNKNMAKGGFAAGKAVGEGLERLGVKGAAKLGAKAGARFIPGLGWVLMGYDAYEGFQKDGLSGAAKNVATLGMYEALKGDETTDTATKVDDPKNLTPSDQGININTLDDIVIASKKDIRLSSDKMIVLKGDKIILDSSVIEIKGKITSLTGNATTTAGTTDDPAKIMGQTNDPTKPSIQPQQNQSFLGRLWNKWFQSDGRVTDPKVFDPSQMGGGRGGMVLNRGGGRRYSSGRSQEPAVTKQVVPEQTSALTSAVGKNQPYKGPIPDFSNGGKDRYNTRIPASIRHNNPGATWDAPWMKDYGMNGVDIIGGGNHIANFPDAISGAAANFDLMDRKYAGKPLSSFIQTWSGGNSSGQYAAKVAKSLGITPDTIITRDMIRDKDFATKMLNSMSGQEAGRENTLSLEQLQAAHGRFRQVRLGEKQANPGLIPGVQKQYDKALKNQDLIRRSKQAIADNKGSNIINSRMPAGSTRSLDPARLTANLSPQIIAEARRVYQESGGNNGAVFDYMAKMGHPKSGAWCAQFGQSVMTGALGKEAAESHFPSGGGLDIASSWRGVKGAERVSVPQPGDIAIADRGVRTGDTGSHFTFVDKVNENGKVTSYLGGNQGGRLTSTGFREKFDYYRLKGPDINEQTARALKGGNYKAWLKQQDVYKTAATKPAVAPGLKRFMNTNAQRAHLTDLDRRGGIMLDHPVPPPPKPSSGKMTDVSQKLKTQPVDTARSVPERSSPSNPTKGVATPQAKTDSPTPTKEKGSAAYSMPATPTSDNSADSVPPSPGSDGSGDYKSCLI